ncbi:MAG: hypothetical protein R2847_11235 [Bacteroidia bacterium]
MEWQRPSALGAGIGSGSNYVEVLTFYNGDLIAGESDSVLPRWNVCLWNCTLGWHFMVKSVAVTTGLSARVSAFKEINGELYCGGTFTQASSVASNSVAIWDGTSWTTIRRATGGQAKIEIIGIFI